MFTKIKPYMGSYIRYTYAALATMLIALIAYMIPFFMVYRMGWLGVPLIIIAGLIADLIAKKGGYKRFRTTALSYGVFCLWICANYFPVIVTAKDYRQSLLEGGYSAEYCDALFRAINSNTIAVLLVLCFVFGVIGAFAGKAVVRKHFEKAGIV